MKWLRALFVGGFVATIVPYGAPRYAATLRLARDLARLPMEQRRAELFGGWYADAMTLRRETPPTASIDFVMLTPAARDAAILAGAALQPRDCRYFDGWEAWRVRRRAEFVHDARAVNAAPGPPPGPADVVVAVDAAAEHLLQRR
ncbi:MAG TPA: hypothetical protein VG323_16180 [Thermoanaerobaculia bacterium]|nr:hypothetical protein [Thermoanaerobaculia bacterium]